uniref:Uncharacterized protein n=1 Tax=viral metagenome TaxID=1070528 RepID=A0A6H2A1N7_9ZZZZ
MYGDEIIESKLSKRLIAPEKAAALIKYTGCIDRAWRIADLVCIEDGDLTHCVSTNKTKRKSESRNYLNDVEEGQIANKQKWEDCYILDGLTDDQYKEVNVKCGIWDVNDTILIKQNKGRCFVAVYADMGKWSNVVNELNWMTILNKNDIAMLDKAESELKAAEIPESRQKDYGFAMKDIKSIREKIALIGIK